jgi:hypothetical protein
MSDTKFITVYPADQTRKETFDAMADVLDSWCEKIEAGAQAIADRLARHHKTEQGQTTAEQNVPWLFVATDDGF